MNAGFHIILTFLFLSRVLPGFKIVPGYFNQYHTLCISCQDESFSTKQGHPAVFKPCLSNATWGFKTFSTTNLPGEGIFLPGPQSV
jgi:hypothetical protein